MKIHTIRMVTGILLLIAGALIAGLVASLVWVGRLLIPIGIIDTFTGITCYAVRMLQKYQPKIVGKILTVVIYNTGRVWYRFFSGNGHIRLLGWNGFNRHWVWASIRPRIMACLVNRAPLPVIDFGISNCRGNIAYDI